MQVVYIGLLLLGVTWAAPTFQPQRGGTRSGCAEEEKIMQKGHHKKHGHYIFKCVYTQPGKKHQSIVKEEEKDKENTALDHSAKKSNQQTSSKKDTIQERDLALLEINRKNQSGKAQKFFANRQTLNEDYNDIIATDADKDLTMSMYPGPTGDRGLKDGEDAASKLHDQEEYSTGLNRKNLQHSMRPVVVTEPLGKENQKSEPRDTLRNIPEDVHYAKIHSENKENHPRDTQEWIRPIKSKNTRHTQQNAENLRQLPKAREVPSDFEGSGYTDLQGRGDNDIIAFSGDGQPFKDIPRKGGVIGSNSGPVDVQTGFTGLREAEVIDSDTRGPGYNEIPEQEQNGRNTFGTRGQTTKEATEVSVVEGSNDIIGSTNFKELPGKEGSRVDANSQNAHQGKVEFHYPQPPSKDKRKEGSGAASESAHYNNIPKNGKGSSRQGTEHSVRNRVHSHETQRFSSKGSSQGVENARTHNRKDYQVPYRQNNKGIPQTEGSWGYRKSHPNRRFRLHRKDSSESSDSGSSSESDSD
ncbi:matrix extracellular phosphoglycoprotein isoform X2 [Ochotona curzoniae]|uniref:matrix extracellular phosphoglycoprotein isoform X2 n=1 Tax=Ochotona curzoniae TaxID=130825 RepID=UPI001B350896|nr:matrix extracellular phosphoglycoprotein isoform X2 [Ochotona curzoniae]